MSASEMKNIRSNFISKEAKIDVLKIDGAVDALLFYNYYSNFENKNKQNTNASI